VGGKNIWNTLKSFEVQKKIVMAIASFDSSSFFHDLAFGANADASGVAALLGALQALSKVDQASLQKQIVFALFTGESWGYIGSRAFVRDITDFTCYHGTMALRRHVLCCCLADAGAISTLQFLGLILAAVPIRIAHLFHSNISRSI
jgi:Zn-dependent M28 family amino/carboxypeptidase